MGVFLHVLDQPIINDGGALQKSKSSHLLLSPLHPFYAVLSSRLLFLCACTSLRSTLRREEEKECVCVCVSLAENSSQHIKTLLRCAGG